MMTKAEFDYLIIGAGPAGLQLGYYLEKESKNYQILEAGDSAGTFFKKFPRHGKLISINKVYTGYDDTEINLRWDWNSLLSESEQMLFKHFSKRYFPDNKDFVNYLNDFANHFNLKIDYGVEVTKITKNGDSFAVLDSCGRTYCGRRLIVATGSYKPYIPDIPGIELAENYTEVSVNPEDFINQKVLVIGKGNSAFETADNLIETASLIHLASPNPVKMAWQTHFIGNLRAVNNNILDTYQLKSQNAILDATIEKIERQNGKFVVLFNYTHANNEIEAIVYDRVIVTTGFRFDASIFDETCQPELAVDDRFPAQTSEWESTNIKNLYFAGTLMQMRDYKKTTSGFIHGFRYNVLALHRIFEQKYEGKSWPSRAIAATPESLMEETIARVNRSSALWQQFGFLCDLIVINDRGGEARYYEQIPADYLHDTELGERERYYTISLEYGSHHEFKDPFNMNRIERHDVDNSERSNFLHPIVRGFVGPTQISEHHIIEDLASEWLEDVHTQPLLEFFRRELDREIGVNHLDFDQKIGDEKKQQHQVDKVA